MKFRYLLLVALILVVFSQSASATSYIDWTGSINDTWVTDASGDMLRFTTDGYMKYGSTIYTNVYIDSSANLFMDGIHIGSVSYVLSTTGSKMTAIVDNNGYLIDIYGYENNMTLDESSVQAVFWYK